MPSEISAVPPLFASEGWYTLSFVARRLERSTRTVQHWARSGLFTRMGIKVIVVPAKGWAGRGITWLYVPITSKYAMLRNIQLDILASPTYPPNDEGIV